LWKPSVSSLLSVIPERVSVTELDPHPKMSIPLSLSYADLGFEETKLLKSPRSYHENTDSVSWSDHHSSVS
jgi:hypothetical protein